METKDVISELVRDLHPVSPLPPPPVRLVRWTMIAAVCAVTVLMMLGLRTDLAVVAANSVSFWMHLLLLGVAVASSAGVALALAIPGEPPAGLIRTAPVVALAAWIAWLAAELVTFESTGRPLWPVAPGWGCVGKAFAVAALPGAVLALMVSRGSSMNVRGAVTFASLAAAAIGALGVQISCPINDPTHLLFWHAGPLVAVVLAISAACWSVCAPIERSAMRS